MYINLMMLFIILRQLQQHQIMLELVALLKTKLQEERFLELVKLI